MRRPAGRDVTSAARPDQSVDTSWAGDEREEEIRHPCVLRGRARGVPRVWILISGRGKDGEGARHARSWRPMTGDVSESLSAVGERKGRAPSPRPGTHRGPSLAAAGTPSLFYDSPSSSPSSSYPCIYFFSLSASYPLHQISIQYFYHYYHRVVTSTYFHIVQYGSLFSWRKRPLLFLFH